MGSDDCNCRVIAITDVSNGLECNEPASESRRLWATREADEMSARVGTNVKG